MKFRMLMPVYSLLVAFLLGSFVATQTAGATEERGAQALLSHPAASHAKAESTRTAAKKKKHKKARKHKKQGKRHHKKRAKAKVASQSVKSRRAR